MEDICIIKTASCLSLSGRSTISYVIGSKGDNQFISLSGNTGAGMYSKAWVSLAQIEQLLSAEQITSRTIQPLYTGSVNSAGFLLAVLKDVGLIQNVEENSRAYVRADPAKFKAAIQSLIVSDTQPQKKKAKKPEAGQEQTP